MGELFKSAYEYFSGPTNGQSENSFVGQLVEISNVKLRIKKVIAEGGFAVVFVAQDVATGKEYALKRLLAGDEDAKANVVREINVLKKLNGHPNIIQYLSASYIDKSQTTHGQFEFLLVTELCTGGSLVEILQSRTTALDPESITRIFYQTCKAVSHLHQQNPPVMHRDLKIENLLINEGAIKLCDFGSATTEIYRPNLSWSANQRSSLEENMARYTTPMYRAPEMVDTWNNYYIGPPVDVWALGCILYTLCYMKHPFDDSAKLRIINANYNLPPDPKYTCFHEIIRGCLKIDPEQRLDVSAVLDRVAAVAESNSYNLKAPLKLQQNVQTEPDHGNGDGFHNNVNKPQPPAPPPQPQRVVMETHNKPQEVKQSGLFSSLRGGAGSFLKNLKDTSTKVMATMQQSMGRNDLDISYVTSKIIVMPFPSEGLESAYRTNHIEDVRLFLDTRHPNQKYSIYNLSGRPYHSKFGQIRVVDCSFAYPEHFRAPLLNSLYQLCEDIYQYLSGDSRNVVVVHCTDGKATSATLVCALLIYSQLYEVPEDALQMFAVKRFPPNMRPSELRYLYYLSGIVGNPPMYPHYKPVTLVSIQMQPVPLFTKIRDGCRPYLEIYSENRCILSTLQDYERMRLYNIAEGKILLPINATVCGDVCIIIYHARNILGGVINQGKATGIKMCQIQFHTGFIQDEETCIRLAKSDLDDISEGQEHYQSKFTVSVNVFVTDVEKKPSQPPPWITDQTKRVPDTMFTTKIEHDETVDNFVSKPRKSVPAVAKQPPQRPAPPSPQPKRVERQESSESEPELPAMVQAEVPPLIEAVDLLNLNTAPLNPTPQHSAKQSPSSNFDLLSGLAGAANLNDITFNPTTTTTQQNTNIFDPFESNTKPSGLLDDWSDFKAPASGSAPPQKPTDLFGDLSGWNTSASSSPQHTNRPSPVTADYSRSHFEPLSEKNDGKPKKMDDVFGDLLGSQGYSFSSKREAMPRTMNAMRKEEMAVYTDPDQMIINDWKEGKKNNIRALLCSLHTVLWDGAKWKKCDMHQLVSAADVKRTYRKACLAVHPDKHTGTDNEKMAKLIFMELNTAWSDFENDATQQNMFAS